MASADIFKSNIIKITAPDIPSATIATSESSLSGLTESTVEPLTINDIKMFESLDLDSSGSSGIGNSNIIEGSLDETDSLLEDGNQTCKICK